MTTKKHSDRELFLEYDVHFPTRTVALHDEINADSARRTIKNLYMLDQESDQPITLLLSSGGGDDYSGTAIYSAIKRCRSAVTIEVSGWIMSMAVFVLQAGDRRVCVDPFMRFMVHEAVVEYEIPNKRVLRAIGEEVEAADRIYNNVLLSRIKEKNPKFTMTKLESMITEHKFFDAGVAFKLGLIDEVQDGS
jgi:ATP-dependent protease ClpP protease subunit